MQKRLIAADLDDEYSEYGYSVQGIPGRMGWYCPAAQAPVCQDDKLPPENCYYASEQILSTQSKC